MNPRRSPAPRPTAIAVAVIAILTAMVAACSGGEDATGGTTTSVVASTAPSPASEWTPPRCDQGATGDGGPVVPVEGSESDLTVTSFDGTEIRAHWFPADVEDPAPTILMGPGWSLPGDTSEEGMGLFGALGIGAMNDAGYNVLTWDPRGFGESTGTAQVDSPDAEGRDVQVLLDWVSTQPEALEDADGDPRVGMVGASYGGGIQLTVASIDCRVDALVPSLGWNSLETSLYRNETVKSGWASTLLTVAAAGNLDPHLTEAGSTAPETGTISDADIEWFRSRGPGDGVDRINAPTLFVQGTVDTLFTLDEAVVNHRSLVERGVPTGMLWFCGGHGACLTHDQEPAWIEEATFAWLDRYVKGDESVDTGPAIVVEDQQGDLWTADAYPDEPADALVAESDGGTLALTAQGGAGPLSEVPDGILGSVVVGITPAAATNAIEVAIDADEDVLLLGAPRLTFAYRGTTPDGPEPTRVFAQLVDDETGTVVGNQITPIPVVLDGTDRTAAVDLESIAHELRKGDRLRLQIVATTVAYSTPRLGGEIDLSSIDVELPVDRTLTAT